MKGTIFMAVSLSVILTLACYTQPVEEKFFRALANAADDVKAELPQAGTPELPRSANPAADEDEEEVWTSC